MAAVWRFVRKWWWAIVAVAGSVGASIFLLFLGDGSGTPRPRSNLQDKAEKEAEKIRLEGEIEKAKITARADTRHEELVRIEELGKEDPAEARKQLSAWINSNL